MSALSSSPAQGAQPRGSGPPLGLGPALRFPSPLPPSPGERWAPPADVCAASAVQAFHNTDTESESSLTSAILLLGAWASHPGWPRLEGARDLPHPTETLFSPYGRDLGRWLPPAGCRTHPAPAIGAQQEPGQPCPHYGPCSATIAYRHYLFYLICKYRKDVLLFIWSLHLYILF